MLRGVETSIVDLLTCKKHRLVPRNIKRHVQGSKEFCVSLACLLIDFLALCKRKNVDAWYRGVAGG